MYVSIFLSDTFLINIFHCASTIMAPSAVVKAALDKAVQLSCSLKQNLVL